LELVATSFFNTQITPPIPRIIMDAIKDTVNSALEKLNITGGASQGAPAKEPSEEQLNELKSKYQKAGQEQVFVRAAPTLPWASLGAPRWTL
jgi:hypothetical protein